MEAATLGANVPAFELDCKKCVIMCGMCPLCAFAAEPPGSVQCLWKVSDEFKRKFLMNLLLRCRNINTLESIQRVLGVTSWTLFTYARSKRPPVTQRHHGSCIDRVPGGKPVGLDLKRVLDWFSSSDEGLKLHYLYRLFSFCDSEMLRMITNLTSVLLVRQKRGFLSYNGGSRKCKEDEDSEDPALMVVPGSFKSASGVSRYRDFIGCLHVYLSKRILDLLDENTLRVCQKVCQYWQYLTQETLEEKKLARKFHDKIKAIMERNQGMRTVSPTHAKIIPVPVPVRDDEEMNTQPPIQEVKLLEAAYAKIKTKTVQMEERNVYCGAYFSTVLVEQEDPHRVIDYRGGSLMATGSKDCVVNLLHVTSQTKSVSKLKGHVGSIRVVLLCEEQDLLISASWDSSIRCWNLKTDTCLMMLYGHTRAVNCLDVHGDKLVSGAKDCLVKVWSLHTGKLFEDLNFKHPSPVQSVKIIKTTVYSSCNRGFIKIWDMENAALLRVINVHKNSVKCLFLDEWHLMSGDSAGQVMAWSTNCDVKDCLMTFNHPEEVKSLTLMYLRVITGCADGKIRVFNFLTGDCLREIKAEAETGRLLSLHFHDNSILVNSASCVKRYQFAKVFWDYTESAERGRADGVCQSQNTKKAASPSLRSKLLYHTCCSATSTKSHARSKERCYESVVLSEKAASARMRKRGLHRPLTRDSILLKVNAMQRAWCTDEASINMERNTQLRDSWGPETPESQIDLPLDAHVRRPKTCIPILNQAASQTATNTTHGRAKCHNTQTTRPIRKLSGFTASAAAIPKTPECAVTARSHPNLGQLMKSSTSFPRISPVSPGRERGGFRLISGKELEDCDCSKRGLTLSCEQKLTRKQEKILPGQYARR